MPARRSCLSLGFSIIEVMVATLLLATVLVAIFGAQFSAVSSTVYVRNITQATQLARCKMSELELVFIEEGFQEGDVVESGTCCEFIEGEDRRTEFNCEWEVKLVQFPDTQEMMSAADWSDDTVDAMGIGGEGLLGEMMGEGLDGGEEGEGMMAELGLGVLEELLPVVTDLLEQAIRRVSVKVTWQEGRVAKDFEIVQYVTHPTQGPLKALQQAAEAERLEDALYSEGDEQ